MSRYRVSMDIGGTFTDVVAYDEASGTYVGGQVIDYAARPDRGGLHRAGAGCRLAGRDRLHGARHHAGAERLLGNGGAKRSSCWPPAAPAAVYHIARGNRTRLYDVHYRKPTPLVPRSDIVEIGGRLDYAGEELEPLDEAAIRAAAQRVKDEGFGAVAVAFLFSYLNPSHELRARASWPRSWTGCPSRFPIRSPASGASTSGRPRRWSMPTSRPSCAAIWSGSKPRCSGAGWPCRVHVMQSSGGIVTAQSARDLALQTILSGPVGGTMGGVALARMLERPNLICVDMGGTSFDVSLVVNGKPDVASETTFEGFPLLMSVVNIHTIGAGGGSLAYSEAGGLRVGPQSAGADPGPASYGRGGDRPTVTDANLVLGRVDPAAFAGGRMTLDRDAAERAVATLASELGLGVIALAEGICDVINAKMAQAIRTLTVEKGIEPRDFALVAFGGAGPMHAVFLARELGIREVIVPPYPGAFSAWGMLETEIRKDFSRTYYTPLAALDHAALAQTLAELEREGFASLADEGITKQTGRVAHAVDVRYVGQEYTLTIPFVERRRAVSSRLRPRCGRPLPRRPPHPLWSRQCGRAGRVRHRPHHGPGRPRPGRADPARGRRRRDVPRHDRGRDVWPFADPDGHDPAGRLAGGRRGCGAGHRL